MGRWRGGPPGARQWRVGLGVGRVGRTSDPTLRRYVARRPTRVPDAWCGDSSWRRSVVASYNASRTGFASGNGTVWPPVGPGSRGEAPRARHRRRQRRRHPGDREAAPLQLRLQSRRVHLPDHGLHLHGQPGDAPARDRARGAGDDGATDHRPVRARAWRRDPHGTAQARVQPGGVLRSLAAHRRRGRGAGAGAASLDADRGAGRGPRPARRRGHARRARATTRRARPAVGLTIMLELIAGILLAAGAVYFVLRPIFRPEMTGNGDWEAGNVSDGEDPEDDFSPRAVALRALKEIEFDRATGKLSDADYDTLKTKYTTEALVALRAEQPGAGSRETGGIGAAPSPVSRLPSPAGPTPGPPPRSGASF